MSFNSNDRKMAVLVAFSYNRAMQLDAMLRSFLSRCIDVHHVICKIIFKASGESHRRQYHQLMCQYKASGNINFIEEKSLKQDLLDNIHNADYILFVVDDCIFVQKFKISDLIKDLNSCQRAIGYSLRLGLNTNYCYSLNRHQALPKFNALNQRTFCYSWPDAEHDFGYPIEISSSLYYSKDIVPIIDEIDFNSPNELEAGLDHRKNIYRHSRPDILCSSQSLAFCIPLNKVQTVAVHNRACNDQVYSAENLSLLYEKGYRIDLSVLFNFIPNACHQEVPLRFYRCDNTVNEKQPLVSVIIPCYKHAQFLRDAVESVVNQTYSNWECIIVNDGSPDNTRTIAADLINEYRHQNIRLLEINNHGLAGARNRGIEFSKGEYILPLDSDDKIHPTALEKMAMVLKKDNHISFVYSDRLNFGETNEIIKAGVFNFTTITKLNVISYCCMYRRKMWESIGGYNDRMSAYEDWEFWISAGFMGFFAKHIQEPLFLYRVKENSMYTEALHRDKKLRAHIILNHPEIYSASEIEVAQKICNYNTRINVQKSENGNDPLVSIIIMTKNEPRYLNLAIQSVMSQSYKNLELIVVNNGGNDIQKILELFQNIAMITYIKSDFEQTAQDALLNGLSAANGKYSAFLLDSDIYYINHIQTLVGALENGGYRGVYSDSLCAIQEMNTDEYVTTRREKHPPDQKLAGALEKKMRIPINSILTYKALLAILAKNIIPYKYKLKNNYFFDLPVDSNVFHIPKLTSEYRIRI